MLLCSKLTATCSGSCRQEQAGKQGSSGLITEVAVWQTSSDPIEASSAVPKERNGEPVEAREKAMANTITMETTRMIGD